MKPYFFLVLLAGAFLLGCSQRKSANSNTPITFHVERTEVSVPDELFAIKQGDEILFEFHPRYRACIMKPIVETDDCLRATAEFANTEGMTLEDCLLDLKGDGDKRFLIVVDWAGGNSAYAFTGWLLDTKDNFAVIGHIPVSEVYDYPKHNPEMVFQFSNEIAYFGAYGSAEVRVPLKIAKGASPQLVMPESASKPLRFNPAHYQEMPREMAIYSIYCDFASQGHFAKADKAAKYMGFTDEEIKTYGAECLKQIRQSELYPYLKEINGGSL